MSTLLNDPALITQYIRNLHGGSQPILAQASDGYTYVVKFANNLQGPNVLFNESAGSELYRAIGLPVPDWRPIMVSDDFIDRNPGCWISASLLTIVLVTSAYLRLPPERRQIPKRMVLTSLALAVLSGIITTISISATPSDNYLAVALSDTPLDNIKPDRKRLMVELIRQQKAASDENSRIAKSMKPISPALYSVESFADKAAMESTSSQLKQAYDIDQTYAAAKLQARRAFHDKMQKVDPAFLRGLEAARPQRLLLLRIGVSVLG